MAWQKKFGRSDRLIVDLNATLSVANEALMAVQLDRNKCTTKAGNAIGGDQPGNMMEPCVLANDGDAVFCLACLLDSRVIPAKPVVFPILCSKTVARRPSHTGVDILER